MGDLGPFGRVELGPIVGTALAAVIGGIATWYSTRRLRKLGLGNDQAQVNQSLRELADVWEEKHSMVSADLVAERTAHAATKALLEDEQRAGDRCRRELDDVRSELRALKRLRRPGATS